MYKQRDWTVLLVGGASGSGKSSVAYKLAEHFNVNVVELDDIHIAVEAASSKEIFPAIHYPSSSSISWEDAGIARTVDWLKAVSLELQPVIHKIVKRHIEDKLPVIIEGDFLTPDSVASIIGAEVKVIFISETDIDQLIANYFDREGGEPQAFRAEVSANYSQFLAHSCQNSIIPVVEARPWDTVVARALSII